MIRSSKNRKKDKALVGTRRKSHKLAASDKSAKSSFDAAYKSIAEILEEARATAYRAVNAAMVQAYWNIGRIIVEEEQKGKKRANYGDYLIVELAHRLARDYGKGFSEGNLRYMRMFYLTFPIRHALRDELSWTHYRLLLKVEKEEARSFYMVETINSNWSTRELERQINSLLYERLLLSKDKKKALPARLSASADF